MKLAAAQINPIIGDIRGNASLVLERLKQAKEKGVDILIFPELTLSGYFPDDLLLDGAMIESCWDELHELIPYTKGMFVVVGLPRVNPSKREKPLHNSAAILIDGKLVGFKDKTLLPTYDVFDERRYFEPGSDEPIWEYRGRKIGVTICEDVWQHTHAVNEYTDYLRDPVADLAEKGLDLLLNLSGSPYYFERKDQRLKLFESVAKTLKCPVLFCNQVGANDQLVFDGHSLFLDREGTLKGLAKGFREDFLIIDEENLEPAELPTNGVKDLYNALVLGVRDYFRKQGFKSALLGLSGGVDSALVACIAKDALGSENVHAIMMPSRYSSKGSLEDAIELAKLLNIELSEVSIEPIFKEFLKSLEPKFQNLAKNETEENLQSRIRGMILMAFSNKFGAIVLNTGNKSEMAMGYTTLYGDMAGGLAVINDVTKSQVYKLAEYTRVIPQSILTKAPSAELKENQIDEDTLPPYEVLDPILEDYIEGRLPIETIAKKQKQQVDFVRNIVRKIHLAEYKRRQAPISIRVTLKAFSKGRIVPIVQKWL